MMAMAEVQLEQCFELERSATSRGLLYDLLMHYLLYCPA